MTIFFLMHWCLDHIQCPHNVQIIIWKDTKMYSVKLLNKSIITAGLSLGGSVGAKVSLIWLNSLCFELREKFRCIEHIGTSKIMAKFFSLNTSSCLRAQCWALAFFGIVNEYYSPFHLHVIYTMTSVKTNKSDHASTVWILIWSSRTYTVFLIHGYRTNEIQFTAVM